MIANYEQINAIDYDVQYCIVLVRMGIENLAFYGCRV